MTFAAIGIDIGGTHARAALLQSNGDVAKCISQAIAGRTPQDILLLIEKLYGELLPATGLRLPLGVGLAATLEIANGHVAVAPNLDWHDVPFGDMLRSHFAMPVRLINDLNAIALAEAGCEEGEGGAHVVCVFVGTGVGMGAVSHGRIVEGADGFATELGHVKIASTQTGRLCGCGERGCLEAYTSGRHLPELYAAPEGAEANAATIERDFNDGHEAARILWKQIADPLGRAIANAVTLFNPRTLVLGGGVLQRAPKLYEMTRASVLANVSRPALRHLVMRDARLGDQAGCIGAGLAAMQTGHHREC